MKPAITLPFPGWTRVFVPAGLLALALGLAPAARAFPPAPHHLLYGIVRDQYGTPLLDPADQILLTTPTGVEISSVVVPNLGYGMNFEIEVPMDSGLTADPYAPDALVALEPFKISVVIGGTTNWPIQMTGNYALLGQPGQQTRVDLTLGVDANGDGLPDAWESVLLAMLGSNLNLNQLNANSRLTPDGLTLGQEFLTGNYPYDPSDPLRLTLLSINNRAPSLQFTAMAAHYYTLLGSSDLVTWTPLSFVVSNGGAAVSTNSYYYSATIQTVQIQAVPPAQFPSLQFYKMSVQ